MHWNHRVIRTPNDLGEYNYAVHEVHYGDDNKITGYTENPIPVFSESLEGLVWLADQIKRSAEIPLLEFDGDKSSLVEVSES